MGDDDFPEDWSDTDKQAASIEPLAWGESDKTMSDEEVEQLQNSLKRNMCEGGGECGDECECKSKSENNNKSDTSSSASTSRGVTIGVPDSIDPDLSELV
jgi:hypothetical protein